MHHDRERNALYLLNFFFTTSVVILTFFSTPFLHSRGVPEGAIGIVYALGYGAGLFGLYSASRIVRKIGSFGAFLAATGVLVGTYLSMPFTENPVTAAATFIAISTASLLLIVLFDGFLEQATPKEGSTGRVRGIFITAGNIAWVGIPLFAGLLVADGMFGRLYATTAGVLIIAAIISSIFLRGLPRTSVRTLKLTSFLARLRTKDDVRHIFIAQFGLRFFFGVMSAYTPIFLIQYLGFSFAEMGLIFTITQTPYLVLELPLGYLADKYWGEKEMLTLGFAIIGVATMALTFVGSAALIVWALMLMATRIGAAMVDIGSESYFFKQVTAKDADTISAFRMLYPLAYILGPLTASVVLLFVDLRFVYVLLGAVMLVPILAVAQIKDSR